MSHVDGINLDRRPKQNCSLSCQLIQSPYLYRLVKQDMPVCKRCALELRRASKTQSTYERSGGCRELCAPSFRQGRCQEASVPHARQLTATRQDLCDASPASGSEPEAGGRPSTRCGDS